MLLASILVGTGTDGNLPRGYDMLVHHCNPFRDAVVYHEAHPNLATRHNLSQGEGPAIKTAVTLSVGDRSATPETLLQFKISLSSSLALQPPLGLGLLNSKYSDILILCSDSSE